MSTSSQPQSTTVDAATIPLPANSPSTVSSSSAATSSAGSNPSFAVGYAAGSVVPNGVPYDPSTAAAYNAYAMQYMNTYQQTYPYAAAAYTQYYGYAPPEASGVSTTATAPNNESQTKVPMPSAKASCSDDAEDDDDDDPTIDRGQSSKASNLLPIWGNEKTMNLNSLVLTNILQSPYFKVNLFQLKTYHEVIDEIYYNVKHLEPWERGSRKTSGQTGMCGSVRGVGAGGIVSTPFCILYKLFTLRLTRKQLVGLLKHKDSPYIRALGFMYVRFTQPPNTFWKWYEPYLDDEEPVEVKAGVTITIGELVQQMMTKLDWYSTLFPRMPIPVQKDIEKKLKSRGKSSIAIENGEAEDKDVNESRDMERRGGNDQASYSSRNRHRSPNRYRRRSHSRSRSRDRDRNNRGRDRDYEHKSNRDRRRSRSRDRYSNRDSDARRRHY